MTPENETPDDGAVTWHAGAEAEPAVPTAPRLLGIPELSLVVLVGVTGSGKSTFAAAHFEPFEVLSSDFCRGLVSNDENDQSASRAAFEVLDFIAGKRLAAGLLTVVDATNEQSQARRQLVTLARDHDVLPVAIVLDVPEAVCLERNGERPDRTFGAGVVARQAGQLRRSLRGLGKEGFRTIHTLRGADEIAAVQVVRERLRSDYRDETGPFDVIGDVHGCRSELESLLTALEYELVRDAAGRPVDATHPDRRRAVFLGDLVDRGPDTPGVLRLVMGMVAAGHAFAVPGNHENKLVRALGGRQVQASHGLAETLAQLAAEPPEFRADVATFCDRLVAHLVMDGGRLVVAHAGLKEAYHNRASGRVRSFALYGDTTGETDEFGLPVRLPWADSYRGSAMVLYGHTPIARPEWVNNTLCLDTGCVFGGSLSALRYPERELVQVPAEQVWYAPVKPLDPAPGTVFDASDDSGVGPGRRDPDVLDIDDVLGRRVVETAHHGRVSVREDNAAGALEVMSRFAIDPHRLWYLPPTMSPTAASTRPELLEHPDEAFEAYRTWGVDSVICEEKHMGSRAVVLASRDGGRPGAIHTRTGRSFFGPDLTDRLLAEIADAVATAGIWEQLETSWVLLDCELMPWSAKAEGLLREQYAATGAAARAGLAASVSALHQASDRGLDVTDLLVRTSSRQANAAAFTAAYRHYVWQTDGLEGVRLAPFQLLASEGATYEVRDHGWHLDLADRLVAAAPGRLHSTRRIVVAVGDEAACAEGAAWWEGLLAGGGEGMVVKPYANLTLRDGRLVQPGIKVRGPDYLRLVYGPDYLEPGNLDRLRQRNLSHKRSLALREYALGLESLARAAAGEPLWRIHEAVFATLALESEPVDPRL